MMRLEKALVVDIVLLVAVLAAYLHLILTTPLPDIYCMSGDNRCIAMASLYKENCTQSSITMMLGNETETVILLLQIRRTWPWGQCVITEKVLEQTGKPFGEYDIKGYGTECVRNADGTGMRCNGSFYEYLVSTLSEEAMEIIQGVGGGGGGSSSDGEGGGVSIPSLFCSLYDDPCKEQAIDYIEWCTPSNLRVTDLTRGSEPENLSYWVKKFAVSRSGSLCKLDVEITSAFNLPPYIPLEIIGMGMTCTYGLSELPKDDVGMSDCAGELVDYFWKV